MVSVSEEANDGGYLCISLINTHKALILSKWRTISSLTNTLTRDKQRERRL